MRLRVAGAGGGRSGLRAEAGHQPFPLRLSSPLLGPQVSVVAAALSGVQDKESPSPGPVGPPGLCTQAVAANSHPPNAQEARGQN